MGRCDSCVVEAMKTNKADCPPVVLFKLPLIANGAMIDYVVETLAEVLKGIS